MKKRFSDEQIINISAKPKLGYRIYQLNGLSVKRRRRRKGLATERLPLLRPAAPNLTGRWISSWTHFPPVAGSSA